MSREQLIDPEELSARLGDAGVVIVDCRFDLADPHAGRKSYAEGHIPAAVFMDLNQDLATPPHGNSGRHPLPDVARFEATASRLGIGDTTAVIVYDGGSGAMAARAWWVFRWLGHENVKLLNGGMAAWKAAGLPVTDKAPQPEPATFVARVRGEKVVSSEELENAPDGIEALNLFDARDASRFDGLKEPIDRIAGHVPGARNLPFTENLDADGNWKSVAELRKVWTAKLGHDRDVDSIVMCGSGVTACHLALSALEAGFKEPRLYVGSWSEWITDPGRPIGRKNAQK